MHAVQILNLNVQQYYSLAGQTFHVSQTNSTSDYNISCSISVDQARQMFRKI